jgi:hypothetical protein
VIRRPLDRPAHVLAKLAEELPKEARQEGAPEVEPLVGVVVAVVLGPPAERTGQEPVRHVPHKKGLARLTERRLSDVGQQFFLEDLARVLDSFGARDADGRRALADVIER